MNCCEISRFWPQLLKLRKHKNCYILFIVTDIELKLCMVIDVLIQSCFSPLVLLYSKLGGLFIGDIRGLIVGIKILDLLVNMRLFTLTQPFKNTSVRFAFNNIGCFSLLVVRVVKISGVIIKLSYSSNL